MQSRTNPRVHRGSLYPIDAATRDFAWKHTIADANMSHLHLIFLLLVVIAVPWLRSGRLVDEAAVQQLPVPVAPGLSFLLLRLGCQSLLSASENVYAALHGEQASAASHTLRLCHQLAGICDTGSACSASCMRVC